MYSGFSFNFDGSLCAVIVFERMYIYVETFLGRILQKVMAQRKISRCNQYGEGRILREGAARR